MSRSSETKDVSRDSESTKAKENGARQSTGSSLQQWREAPIFKAARLEVT